MTAVKQYSAKLFQVNSNWTSLHKMGGWRHFRISGRRWQAEVLELEMMAVCDRKVRVWVKEDELGDQNSWEPGWAE